MESSNKQQNYLNATGKIDYTLLNDYMFRMIMQKHKTVLKGLTCATLQLKPDEIIDIRIENPIELGDAIDNKEFVLDVKVSLNNNTIINYELQVVNYGNWPDRSLSYLCRSYDSLYRSEDYRNTKRAIHVGILDFDPFPEFPEFFSQYKMINVGNHHVYNDKFQIRVLKLRHISLATDKDKEYGLDKWAAIFKAKTWEEIKQLAKEHPDMETMTEQLYEYNAEKAMREKCQARADFLMHEKRTQQEMAELKQQLEEKDKEIEGKDRKIEEKDRRIEEKDKEIEILRQMLNNQ